MTKRLFVPSLSEYVEENLPHLKRVKRVNRYTRAGKNGKTIECPKCKESAHVYHFSWSAITCQSWEESINKEDWIIPV